MCIATLTAVIGIVKKTTTSYFFLINIFPCGSLCEKVIEIIFADYERKKYNFPKCETTDIFM